TINALTNGTNYNVVLRADNGVGVSSTSVASGGTPRSVPGAPVQVQAIGSPSSAQVSWLAPLSSGGSNVVGYSASAYAASTGGSALATCASTSTSCQITGLSNDTTYYFDVTATNAAGTGLASS